MPQVGTMNKPKPKYRYVPCKQCGAIAHPDGKVVATWVDHVTELCDKCSKKE